MSRFLVGIPSGMASKFPYDEARLKETISKKDLGKAKDDCEFVVINLETKEFFHPEKNAWVKIKEYSDV